MILRPAPSLFIFLLLLVPVFYAAITQGNNLAYTLGFTVIGLAFASILRGRANVGALLIEPRRQGTPPFAGDAAHIPISVTESRAKIRFNVQFAAISKAGREFGLTGRLPMLKTGEPATVMLPVDTTARGRHQIGRLSVTTRYPLALFTCGRRFEVELSYLVYPKPVGNRLMPSGKDLGESREEEGKHAEGDYFAGFRPFQPGDSQRHVDWKAVARGREMQVKVFTGGGDREVWLDYDELSDLTVEARLSQLTRWVIDLEHGELEAEYGLRLPGERYQPSRGPDHYHRCLEALALFNPPKNPMGNPRETDNKSFISA